MRRGLTGTYEYSIAGGDTCQAFVPLPLPPRPALSLDADLQERLNAAHLALGRLDEDLRRARVAVTGRVDRGLLSTCQQGVPLVVTKLEPAP